ncbi:MAG: sialate O-acetylesterase [Bacteroidia bacterium]|nr:MAG: sialate O-acetylesterase [Bacteroidia bacterium]
MRIKALALLLLHSFLWPVWITGQNLHLASVFGDHMVIQQGINAPVWGTDLPGTRIRVDFAGFITEAIAMADGKWIARMPVLEEGGPYRMKVTGSDTIVFDDVMVGEVWLASGQSNMEWRLASGVGPDTGKEIAEADHPRIRFFTVPKKTSIVALGDTETQEWIVCSPSKAGSFSAVAYFFARELTLHKKVAVGIISSSWGATSAEAWISSEMLSSHPDFTERVAAEERDTAKWNSYVRYALKAESEREVIARTSFKGIEDGVTGLSYDDTAWETCCHPAEMKMMGLDGYWGLVWLRKHFIYTGKETGKEMKLIVDVRARDAIIYINGSEVAHLSNPGNQTEITISKGIVKSGHNVLSVRLYVNWGSASVGSNKTTTSIIADGGRKLIPLDGEWKFSSEIETPVAQWQDYYNRPSVLFNGLIAPVIPYGIRGVIWYQGENNAGNGYQYRTLFPLLINDWRIRWQLGNFPFLYVQLANFIAGSVDSGESNWAELREAQMMTLGYPATGMAVTIDIGDPEDIHPWNKLDVGRRLFLQARKVAYNEDIVASGPRYRSMKIEKEGIRISFDSEGSGLASSDSAGLKGFTIAGSDGKFFMAEAAIDGDEVIVSSPFVYEPVAVRYGWKDNPGCTLINSEGLPASPFRTDDWRGL